mgnify:FL=1
MGKRRPSGDGMVRKRENSRWEGRIVIGHRENGDSIFRYIYADSQKELTAKLRQNIEAYQGVDLTEDSRMTLAEWLDRWLEQVALTIRPSTLARYRSDMEHHVEPYLGHKKLTQITAADLRNLYQTLQERGRLAPRPGQEPGLSPTTVHSIHTTLHQALQAAVEQRMIPDNPAMRAEPPKIIHRAMNILTEEQMERFLAETNRDIVWRDFFYTELTTGLRLGEICGLMWSDFDERKGTLRVCRTLRKEKGGRLVAGDTKTYAGTRTILLPSRTAERLADRKKRSYSPWIFPNPLQPEAPLNPSTAYRQLKKFLADAGLPDLRFHDLRHTFATHALASGVDAKTLSGILGHTKASFTLDTYTHTTGDLQKRAAEIIGGFLTDYLGEEMAPWQNAENGAVASI